MTHTKTQIAPVVAQTVTRLVEVVTCLRTELNKDLPIQHIALILAVVQQPGISMQQLMERLGMPQGSVSRNVKLLSDAGRGYGLLRNEQDLVNRKQVIVFPTEKCINLVARLCQLLQDEMAEEVKLCQCKPADKMASC